MKKINEEVYYSGTAITRCDAAQIKQLTDAAEKNVRRRVRLCTHEGVEDKLHEMLIVHEQGCYVRPHKHPGKAESIHIIKGLVDIVFFDENGEIKTVMPMGDFSSGLPFYLRIGEAVYHTLIIKSAVLVFHETTTGPFDRSDTVFAPWSPEDAQLTQIEQYLQELNHRIKNHEHE